MKKAQYPFLIIITAAFLAFTFGFFLGKNQSPHPVTVSIPASMHTAPEAPAEPSESTCPPTEAITFPININTAELDEFMALPGIGEVLARRILAYREEHTAFSTVYELMNVEGIGEKRMEEILALITTGG